MTVTLTLFHTRGQHTDQKIRRVFLWCIFLLVAADKFNRDLSFDTTGGRGRECVCCELSPDGRWQGQPDSPCIRGRSAIACEQEFWFGLSRFIREIPNQRVCLAGFQRYATVTLTLFHTRLQHTNQKMRRVFLWCIFLLVVADKFNWTLSVDTTGRKREGVCLLCAFPWR